MPDKRIVRDLKQLQAWLEQPLQQRAVRMVSLDIFDTLLARVDTPEQVQRAVCRELSAYLQKAYTPDQLWLARQRCEQVARQQALQAGQDYECRFRELVAAWVVDFSGEPNAAVSEFILQTELRLEKLALYVKPGVPDLLDWLRGHSVRIVAISDMYLEGELIRELLADKGLLHYFERVYVSADTLLCKYSGRLYAHVREQERIASEQWVHVGDNPVSDRRAACEQGIQGVWLYDKPDIRRIEQQQLAVTMAARGSIWKGRYFFSVLEQRMRALEPNQDSEDFYYRYGRDVLGAAFSACVMGLQERLARKPVDKLFFVARDGYLFQQMYQQLDDTVDNDYIYLSRKVITAAATAEGLTRDQAQVAFYNPKQQGLHSVCKVYGLPEDRLAPLARRHGFSDFAEPLADWHDPRLLAFLADAEVQACIRPVGQEHRELLEAYLEQMGFFSHTRVSLVDIGWNGTVQRFLKQAFGHREDFPVVHGYYFAFVPKMYNDFGRQNYCEGIIHDSRRDNACERIPAEFEEIFEQGARALEATTVGYRRVSGRIEPVLKSSTAPDRRAEIVCNRMVAAMQEGVMTHWRHARAVQALTGHQSADLLPYVYGLLERAVVYPTREETRMLTRLVHTEDFGHDHVLELGKQSIGWRDVLRPYALLQRIQQSAWRYALLDSIPTSLANFAFRVAYLHAVKK